MRLIGQWRSLSDQKEALRRNGAHRAACIAGRSFQPLQTMPAEMAAATGAKGKLRLEPRGSKFQKFQELKLQELAEEVGVIPGSRNQSVIGDMIPAGPCMPTLGHESGQAPQKLCFTQHRTECSSRAHNAVAPGRLLKWLQRRALWPRAAEAAGAGSPEHSGQQLCNKWTLSQAAHTSAGSCGRCRSLHAGSTSP